jgi:hypothetical protein
MSEHLPASAGKRGPIRIGDAERDRAVALLSEHFVAGRLTQEEFEERSDHATRARYGDDLTPLFADLPDPEMAAGSAGSPGSPGFRPGSVRTRTRSRPRSGPPRALAPVLMLALVIAAVLLTAPWLLWGLLWIALFTGFHRQRHWNHRHWNHRQWHHDRWQHHPYQR